jgi:hypothetical protein
MQYWVVSDTPPQYWLDWNIMQVIMIARLYAMYQGSRQVLIFLVVICLVVRIANIAMTSMILMRVAGGKLSLCMKYLSTSSSLSNTRGSRSLRHLSVHDWLYGRCYIHVFHDLDTWRYMGGPCTVSRSLDCSKALPWTATTLNKRWYYWGRLHRVDENSRELLCEVSS